MSAANLTAITAPPGASGYVPTWPVRDAAAELDDRGRFRFNEVASGLFHPDTVSVRVGCCTALRSQGCVAIILVPLRVFDPALYPHSRRVVWRRDGRVSIRAFPLRRHGLFRRQEALSVLAGNQCIQIARHTCEVK